MVFQNILLILLIMLVLAQINLILEDFILEDCQENPVWGWYSNGPIALANGV
ncbi:hypothetical protein [Tychonema sp. LEGE 07203]|uniref:hypothetical protein n=1 Tax=Tychonema sp. LEGE 07203 TaxID=1828671 RepID=UPI001D152079|nr:hypothetical protein [Tychonema sp. LEGE 07203]